MAYIVRAADSIVYELLLSFLLYKRRANLKYLDKGTEWIQEVDEKLTSEFKKEIDTFEELAFGDVACVFIEQCQENHQINTFLEWLKSLSATQMYESLAPHLRERDSTILLELEKQRDLFVYFISEWNVQYFQSQANLHHLKKASEAVTQAINDKISPAVIVENFASGLQIEMKEIKYVHLIPSIHFSPLHTFSILKENLFVWFPIQVDRSNLKDIVNMGKCLSDRKRLEILQFLSTGAFTFTDVLKQIGGAKGNIHHHIMTLRAGGLVRIHIADGGQTFLASTRKSFIPEIKEKLNVFLFNQH
ncbi:winged helix-turn-helix domain-containing protein [Paenibacillus psychroresistens]|nr:winged helix-turn-helix domain-containing protein [Paenibacillus psychroresistens]